MFHGEFESSLDDKGRVILPAKIREAVNEDRDGQGFYSTLGDDGCIQLCTPVEWDRRVKLLREAPFPPEETRRHLRLMSALTERSFADKQGRIHFSQNLLQVTGIQKRVTIIGNFDVVEVWDSDQWQKIKAESLLQYKNDANRLFTRPGGA